LHQASFRDAVLSAYGGRCAISHLPEPRLLDAAHIVMDADEQLGQPVMSNGLPLSKVHHAARPPGHVTRDNKKSLIQN
jgi:putative restriction endonuclease